MVTQPQFCENCGAPLAPDVSFCESCGSRTAAPVVQAEAEAPRAASPTPVEAPAKPASGKRSKWMMIGGIALVAVVILTGGYIWKIQNNPNWLAKGMDFAEQGNYDEAIKAYDEAIRHDPKDDLCWNRKGDALYYQGNYDEAIKCYDEAIGLAPNNTWHRIDKGDALYKQGKYDEAIKCYDESIRLYPTKIPWNGKGNTRYSQGKYDEAIKCYDESIRLDPKDAVIWHNKGDALKLLGRTREADEAFARARELGYQG